MTPSGPERTFTRRAWMAVKKTVGYSGTPLAKKLGMGPGVHVLTRDAPKDYAQLLHPAPDGLVFDCKLSDATDIVHVFSTRRGVLEKELAALRSRIRQDAAIWVSWPKKSAKVPT